MRHHIKEMLAHQPIAMLSRFNIKINSFVVLIWHLISDDQHQYDKLLVGDSF